MYQSMLMDEMLRLKNAKIIDVREPDEHSTGTIPGALKIPLNSLPDALNRLNSDEKYYVVCHSGARSSVACNYLSKFGFDVVNVMGGMAAYKGRLEHEM